MNGSASGSGLAVAARQGAIQLRDLHEDTTRPGQGREGGREEAISLSTCLSIHWEELFVKHSQLTILYRDVTTVISAGQIVRSDRMAASPGVW